MTRNKNIYRFTYEYYDEGDYAAIKSKGLITAKSYTEAIQKIETINTVPGQKNNSNLISVNLYEVDSFDGLGIIEDDEIKEALKENEDD